MASTFPLPPVESVFLRSPTEARAAFLGLGWRAYATPISLDGEQRRLLNIDLTEPDIAWFAESDLAAVAHFEADLSGEVTHMEITAAASMDPIAFADALIPGSGEPRVGGNAEAREWIWEPASGNSTALPRVGGEPLRLWVCAERAYGDRLWAVASLIRRPSIDD